MSADQETAQMPLQARPRRLAPAFGVAMIILVMLGYSLLLGSQIAGEHDSRGLMLLSLPLGILACVFTARYFQSVVLALPLSALAIPLDLPTGTSSKLPFSLLLTFLLTGIWVISMGLRGWKLARSPLNTPLLIFMGICVISFFWGIVWRDPGLSDWTGHFLFVQIVALATILLSLCSALLIGNFATEPRHLTFLVVVFIVCSSLMTIERLSGFSFHFLNGGGLRAMWLIAPAYGLLIAQPGLRWRWRLPLIVMIVLTLYQTLILDTLWVSGWLPNLIAMFAITFFRSRKTFIALVIIAAIVYQHPIIKGYFAEVTQENIDEGAMERVSIWEQNWLVVSKHWLFGTGPAGYAIYYMTYYQDDARSTHNNYLDILAQFGFSGILAWIWLMVASLREAWKLVQRAPLGIIRTTAIIAAGGWVGALTAMFLGDWVLPFAYNQTVTGYKYTVHSWLFLGTLIAIRRMLDQNQAIHPIMGASVGEIDGY